MSAIKPYQTSIAILPSSLTHELTRFREQLETDAGEAVHTFETNAALLLWDLCLFFELGPAQREQVLGYPAASYVVATLETEVAIADEPLPRTSGSDTVLQTHEPRD